MAFPHSPDSRPARRAIPATAVFRTFLVLFACQFGCQAPQPPTTPTSILLEIPDVDRFIDSTLTVLRETDFQPRIVDRTNGVILTTRSTGAQWFEFWRSDVRGGYQLLESSIATIGRSVNISVADADPSATPTPGFSDDFAASAAPPPNPSPISVTDATPATNPTPAPTTQEYIEPPPRSGRFRVTVEVEKYRYSQPDRQLTTTAGAVAMFNERNPTTEGLRGKMSRTNYWIPLGRDGLAEEFLLQRIVAADPQVTKLESR